MAPQESDIISALNILLNAPDKILQLHRELVFRTWSWIEKVLEPAGNKHVTILDSANTRSAVSSPEGSGGQQQQCPCTNLLSCYTNRMQQALHVPDTDHQSHEVPLQLGSLPTLKRKRDMAGNSRLLRLSQAVARRLPEILEDPLVSVAEKRYSTSIQPLIFHYQLFR